ncbi:hypothetical protein B0H16DRAFT_1734724 [Mycena metata]|uniref:DUF6534 domain-containing protein n=1 Tax=Mycena metata TaxID=1033252 RepID=A0AAD7MR62_9AGAR|nr:hypothetical protein B0H16DRAFT_1734724 [Mycena metata]
MSSTSLSVILGAVVLTGILGALFFGAASIQTYNYYYKYRSDGIVLKAAVGALWFVDALHIGFYTYTIWYYVVEAFYTAWIPQVMNWFALLLSYLSGHRLNLYSTQEFQVIHMALGGADPLARSFLYFLDLQNIVPGLVGLCVAAGNIVAVVLGVRIIIFTSFTNIYDISRSALIYSFFGLFCVKATAIAAAMYFFLSDSNEGFTHESNTPIRRAIKLVVGSAVIVSACSFATLACHLAMPHSMSCVVVYMIVSKVYHTCFLSLLGCRHQASAIYDPSMVAMQISEVGNGHGHGYARDSTVVDGSEAASFKA